MTLELDPIAVRVLGCLLEKERTTPNAYPLTPNALVSACNQSSARAPLMAVTDAEAVRSVEDLKASGLARVVHASHGARSDKYRQVAVEAWDLDDGEAAVLALLALRGPQTPGELRQRSDRLHDFAHVDEVQRALEGLAAKPEPLAVRLPRRLGQKELRWAHLLSGAPVEVDEDDDTRPVRAEPRPDRVAELEARVASLESLVGRLAAELGIDGAVADGQPGTG